MHAWLAAAADTRIMATAAVSGVQDFSFAIRHKVFQARVESLSHFFGAVAQDLGKANVDAGAVQQAWSRIAPGLTTQYDARQSLPCIAPRPLLVAMGELDARCPLQGKFIRCASQRV